MHPLKEKWIRRDRNAESVGTRPWSDLSFDILSLIIKNLCNRCDRIRFGAVCKNWHTVLLNASPIHKLPWLMKYNRDDFLSSCELIDPSYSLTYYSSLEQIYTIGNKGIEDESEIYKRAVVIASRKGWLLVQSRRRREVLFLYNFFEKKFIKLPSLDIEFYRATFSDAAPTSLACVIFAIQCRPDNTIQIRTYQRGDAAWRKNTFEGAGQWCNNVAYDKTTSAFYCLFKDGILGAFRFLQNKWCNLTHQPEEKFLIAQLERYSSRLLIGNDGLPLLVFFPRNLVHRGPINFSDLFIIFKFNLLKMDWNQENNIGNDQIVSIDLAPGTKAYSISVEEGTRDKGNRIYFHTHYSALFYSFKSHRVYPCSGDMCPCEEKLQTAWIEPPSW